MLIHLQLMVSDVMKNFAETAIAEFKTILDFLRYGLSLAVQYDVYYGHGTDNAWDEMIALIFGSLSLPLTSDPILFQARLTTDEKIFLIEQLKKRLVDKVPVPYLTKQAFFCGLSFYVDERVLIPRSPMAELIEQQFSPWLQAERVERILDLCTGSGCLAIACHYAFPNALIDATDISKSALEVATINRKRHQLEDTLNLIESDGWEKVTDAYDLIVANPPYVNQEEMQTLPPEYYHEPVLALKAEKNGLAVIEKILTKAHIHLKEGGILVVEVGNSEEALMALFPDLAFTWLDFERGGQGVFLLTKEQLSDYFQ